MGRFFWKLFLCGCLKQKRHPRLRTENFEKVDQVSAFIKIEFSKVFRCCRKLEGWKGNWTGFLIGKVLCSLIRFADWIKLWRYQTFSETLVQTISNFYPNFTKPFQTLSQSSFAGLLTVIKLNWFNKVHNGSLIFTSNWFKLQSCFRRL